MRTLRFAGWIGLAGMLMAPAPFRHVSVPFGVRSSTAPLSDHAGFVIAYAVVRNCSRG